MSFLVEIPLRQKTIRSFGIFKNSAGEWLCLIKNKQLYLKMNFDPLDCVAYCQANIVYLSRISHTLPKNTTLFINGEEVKT